MAVTLHYKFAENKTLVAETGPTLTSSRAGTATYVDASGDLATAASNVARFTHDKDGVSLGVLIEEARTNICLYSEDFGSGWIAIDQGAKGTPNSAVAPDGTTTADVLMDNNAGGGGHARSVRVLTLATSTEYTLSRYYKAKGLDWARLFLSANGSPHKQIWAYFDLTNGVVGSTGSDNTGAWIEDVGNGWFRCSVSGVTDASDTYGQLAEYVAVGDNDTFVDLDGTSSVYVWGAQLEVGEAPTSYIKTTTTSVTRPKDTILTTDVSWYTQGLTSPGTFFQHAGLPVEDGTGPEQWLYELKDSGDASGIRIRKNSGGSAFTSLVSGGSTTQGIAGNASGPADWSDFKVVTRAEENNLKQALDGTVGTADTSSSSGLVAADGFGLGRGATATDFPTVLIIKEFAYFDEALSDSTIAALTDGSTTVEGVYATSGGTGVGLTLGKFGRMGAP